MAQVGTFVTATEVPPTSISIYDVATAFVVGVADWGPIGTPILVTSMGNMAHRLGTPSGTGNPYSARTATCATLFDALEEFFGEGGYRAYVTRVASGTPTSATLGLLDGTSAVALTVTALYPGAGGNGLYVAVQNSTSTYTLTIQDAGGHVMAVSPALSSLAAGAAWASTTAYVTAVVGSGSALPATVAATPLSGGDDNHSGATLTEWQNALSAFSPKLGPGQVFAPGQTNTSLNGIWSALGLHAQNTNRVAVCDMRDDQTAETLVSDIGSFGATGVGSYCGFWAGDLLMPGIVPNTTRSTSPSACIAGLCARADTLGQGNVNQAAAGSSYPLQYATQNASVQTGANGALYSDDDLFTLNDAGINTFAERFGLFENYGFVSSVPSTSDAIYWQWNHARLRMALIADAQIAGEPFVFSQIDGQGADQLRFQSVLQNMLTGYYQRGALFGATAADAFSVDVGPDINTPESIQAGQLNAIARVRMSPFAQKVTIQLQAVPITQGV